MRDIYYPRSKGAVLTTTPTVVYTAPISFTAEIESIIITNTTNSNSDVTVEWYDAGTATWFVLFHARPLAGYAHVQLENSLFLIKDGKIRATAGTHGAVTISLKIKEHFIQTNV